MTVNNNQNYILIYQQPKKKMSRTKISPSFSHTSSTRTKPSMINSNAASTSPFDKTPDSPHPLSARTFKNPRATWSMNPLKDALPGSPPPVCGGGSSPLSSSATLCTPISDSFYSDLPTTEFSTPRNKVYTYIHKYRDIPLRNYSSFDILL